MLVFSRKRDEAIVIGDGVEVRVLRIGRDGVRLGIQAPTSVPVHRREIYDLIRAENQTAAQASVATPTALVARLRQAARAPAPGVGPAPAPRAPGAPDASSVAGEPPAPAARHRA